MAEELRLGIMCGSTLERWQAEALRQALAVEGVRPVVVITQAGQAEGKPGFQHALWRWYVRKRLMSGVLAPVSLPDELATLPRIHASGNITAIRTHAPDVILCFGARALPDDLIALPRNGVWALHAGDPESYPGSIPGFWEMHHHEPVMGVALLRLGGSQGPDRVLEQGWFRTAGHSLPALLEHVLPHAADWMARTCRSIRSGRSKAEGTPLVASDKAHVEPGNAEMLSFLVAGHREVRHIPQHEWNIGILYAPITTLLTERPSLNVRWLPAPGPGQSRETPAGHVVDDRLNVLYCKRNATGNGVISRLRPRRDNVLKRSRTMLENEHDLSYPCVIQHNGQILVLPGSSAGRLDLYRVDEANEALEFVRTILDEPLCAPTLFQHHGRWWLFGTSPSKPDTHLHIFHSPDIEGPWLPHTGNPVKMDVRSARPAGTPFIHQGVLYRPAADDSEGPGHSVALMRILELSPTSFREERVRTIGPIKGSAWSHGTGMLNPVDGMTLVAGRRPMPPVRGSKGRKQRSSSSGKHRERSPDRDQELEDEDDR